MPRLQSNQLNSKCKNDKRPRNPKKSEPYAYDKGCPTAKELKDAFKKFSKGIEPNLFVTASVDTRLDYIADHTKLDKFINAMIQQAHGKKWARLPLDVRPTAVGYLEHPNTNPHFHLIMHAPDPVTLALLNHGKRCWRKFMHCGDCDVQVIRNVVDVVNYCTKEQISNLRLETAYVYSPRHR